MKVTDKSKAINLTIIMIISFFLRVHFKVNYYIREGFRDYMLDVHSNTNHTQKGVDHFLKRDS